MKAIVTVSLKKEVLDPQGEAIRRAAVSLGYDTVTEVRQGKRFEITLDATLERKAALALLAELAEKLLANPVIEDFHVESIQL
jgi:phosphoribosylformylglycinamidine synthase